MIEENKLIDVVLESGTFQTERMVSKYATKGEWKPLNPKHILSFIPGTVLEIKSKVGDSVKAGEVLMIFGAMKMDNTLCSGEDGIIKSINVKVGESVPKGHIMIELI